MKQTALQLGHDRQAHAREHNDLEVVRDRSEHEQPRVEQCTLDDAGPRTGRDLDIDQMTQNKRRCEFGGHGNKKQRDTLEQRAGVRAHHRRHAAEHLPPRQVPHVPVVLRQFPILPPHERRRLSGRAVSLRDHQSAASLRRAGPA